MDGHGQVSQDALMHPHSLSAKTQPAVATDLGASADSLAGLREEFPAFRIWREIMGDRIQYVARRRNADTHPHSVVTADPVRLRSALSTALTGAPAGPDDEAAGQ
jgi:hypothetical protein